MNSVTLELDDLGNLVEQVTAACRVAPGERVDNNDVNELAFSAFLPGGGGMYPAIWVQDFTMIFYGGALSNEDGMNHFRLILQCQNDELRHLQNDAWIPAGTIPDHVLLDGRPVFFPGTYSAGEDQGGEPWGRTPPYNNHFDIIWLAYQLLNRCGDTSFFNDEIEGQSIYDRLRSAYAVPKTHEETGIVHTSAADRAVGFIFCDSIYMTGDLLMASLLRIRASDQMSEIAAACGRDDDELYFREQAALGRRHLYATFRGVSDGDWLRATTGVSGQSDVWGTIYALVIDGVPAEVRAMLIDTIVDALTRGTIEHEGALRHVPTDRDFSGQTMWERAVSPHGHYQNGAYWHMPTGWLVSVLRETHADLGHEVFGRYLAHMRSEAESSFEGKTRTSWECIGRDRDAYRKPLFGPSVTVPFGHLSAAV